MLQLMMIAVRDVEFFLGRIARNGGMEYRPTTEVVIMYLQKSDTSIISDEKSISLESDNFGKTSSVKKINNFKLTL